MANPVITVTSATGTVTDARYVLVAVITDADSDAITSAAYRLNGGALVATTQIALAAGIALTLQENRNTIHITATDAAVETGTTTVDVTYSPRPAWLTTQAQLFDLLPSALRGQP